MDPRHSLDRRSFLRSAGMTALAGAIARPPVPLGAGGAGAGEVTAPADGLPRRSLAEAGRFDFDTVYPRLGTDCVKYDQQIRTFGAGSIDVGMGISDMDFRGAPCITKALQARTAHENWGYLDMGTATPAMAESVAAWNRRRYGVTIDPATIVVTNGVHPALIFAIQALSPRGSKVLLTTPAYDGFYSDLVYTGTIAEESPMRFENGQYRVDYADFERRISHDTHTFILCNPHNPTGNCWSAEELTKIGEICLRRRVVVLADEIHCDFVSRGQRYTPFVSLPNKDIVHNSISFNAASKAFNLSAHKVGWFYSTNADLMARVLPFVRNDLTTLGIVANRAAYAEGEEWLNQAAAYIEGNRDFVASYIHDRIPTIKLAKPQATFLCWLDVGELLERVGAPTDPKRTPEEHLQRFLVERAKVHVNPGSNYGKGGAGHMRMNISTSRKQVELALGNIAAAVKNL
jgi:cystathionine beta-lyase